MLLGAIQHTWALPIFSLLNGVKQDADPLPHPIMALGGTADPNASLDDLHAWRNLTTATFSSQLFPGGHFYLLDRTDLVTGAVVAALPYDAT